MPGPSRLDRLLDLLQNAPSEVARSTASEQIVGLTSDDFEASLSVIGRVVPYIRSLRWETRIAAGKTIGLIARKIISSPPPPPMVKTEPCSSAPPLLDIDFDSIDLRKMEREGKPLGKDSPEGQAWDISLIPPEGKNEEGLQRFVEGRYILMRTMLEERLGIRSKLSKHVFHTPKDKKPTKTDTKTNPSQAPITARMKAMNRSLKRKGVSASTSSSKKRLKGNGEDSKTASVGEAVRLPLLLPRYSRQAQQFPLCQLCRLLSFQLADPIWEHRHGAAVTLRDILRSCVHAAKTSQKVGKISDNFSFGGNGEWVRHVSAVMVGVLCLDKFADYSSSTVVPPVRQTLAQAVGYLMFIANPKVRKWVWHSIQSLTFSSSWDTRFSGFLSAKYMITSKSEILRQANSPRDIFQRGLLDSSEDVRSSAAGCLHALLRLDQSLHRRPVGTHGTAKELKPTWRSLFVCDLLPTLWDSLKGLDDLSASSGAVIPILATIYSNIRKLPAKYQRLSGEISGVVGRLFPFVAHSIQPVALSAIQAIVTILSNQMSESSGSFQKTSGSFQKTSGSFEEKSHVKELLIAGALHVVLQAALFDLRDEIQRAGQKAWKSLLLKPRSNLSGDSNTLLPNTLAVSLALAITPIGQYAPTRAIYLTKRHHSNPPKPNKSIGASPLFPVGGGVSYLGGAVVNMCGSREFEELVERKGGGKELSESPCGPYISFKITDSNAQARAIEASGFALGILLASNRAFTALQFIERILRNTSRESFPIIALTVAEAFDKLSESNSSLGVGDSRFQKALSTLGVTLSDNLTLPTSKAYDFEGLQTRLAVIAKINGAVRVAIGLPKSTMSSKASTIIESSKETSSKFPTWIQSMKSTNGGKITPALAKVSRLVQVLDREVANVHTLAKAFLQQIWACSGCALIQMSKGNHLSLPDKLNPLIKPVLGLLKSPPSLPLQEKLAISLGDLILTVAVRVPRKPNPGPKLLNILAKTIKSNGHAVTRRMGEKGEGEIALHLAGPPEEKLPCRGARLVIERLAFHLKDEIFAHLPSLLSHASFHLSQINATTPKSLQDPLRKELSGELKFLRALVGAMNGGWGGGLGGENRISVVEKACALIGKVVWCLGIEDNAIRVPALSLTLTYAQTLTHKCIPYLLEFIISLIAKGESKGERMGGVVALCWMVREVQNDILCYLALFVRPLLKAMTDTNEGIRTVASFGFAHVVRLIPLERAIPSPKAMDKKLAEKREIERVFLAQLLEGGTVEAFQLPIKVTAKLRAYQHAGVDWLHFLYKFNLNGLLCDDMGLGKTLQSICMVASAAKFHADTNSTNDNTPSRSISLVVCPSTLVAHWAYEIGKFVDALDLFPIMYLGNRQEKDESLRTARRALKSGEIPPSDKNKGYTNGVALIVSYRTLARDIKLFRAFRYLKLGKITYCISSLRTWYIVLDEGHVIKNPKSGLSKALKTLDSSHRLILSGTPVQNQVLDLWSLFDFLMPGYLGTYTSFNARYTKPVQAAAKVERKRQNQRKDNITEAERKKISEILSAGGRALSALKRQVLPFVMRRVKGDVLKDLPPKILQDIHVSPSALQIALMKAHHDRIAQAKADKQLAQETGSSQASKAPHVFQALNYLRRLCTHPSLVLNSNDPSDRQVVQREGCKNTIRDIIHGPKLIALQELLTDQCGMVRQDESEGEGGGGLEGMRSVASHRALIFAQLRKTLDLVEEELLKKHLPGVTYMRIDGSIEPRARVDIANRFNNDPGIDLLLLTTAVGGLGLNLPGADTVIFIEHDWNPTNDLQAMDRAHRLGQKKVVNVYRLIVKDTLEVEILGLQRFKTYIANTLITESKGDLKKSQTGEVLDLLKVSSDAAAESANAKSRLKKSSGSRSMSAAFQAAEEKEMWDESQYNDLFSLDEYMHEEFGF